MSPPMVTSPLSDEALEAIEAGCAGVTPGPYRVEDKSGVYGDMFKVAECECDHDMRWRTARANAAHISRLDPATILSMVHEIRAARTARAAVQPVMEAASEVVTRLVGEYEFRGDSGDYTPTDQERVLLELACQRLRQQQLVRPSVVELERLIGSLVEQAHTETYRRLARERGKSTCTT